MFKCFTAVEILDCITNKLENQSPDACPLLFDETLLNSDLIQRPCQYLEVQQKTT